MLVVFHHKKSVVMDTNDISKERITSIIEYNAIEFKSIPEKSILGLNVAVHHYTLQIVSITVRAITN